MLRTGAQAALNEGNDAKSTYRKKMLTSLINDKSLYTFHNGDTFFIIRNDSSDHLPQQRLQFVCLVEHVVDRRLFRSLDHSSAIITIGLYILWQFSSNFSIQSPNRRL